MCAEIPYVDLRVAPRGRVQIDHRRRGIVETQHLLVVKVAMHGRSRRYRGATVSASAREQSSSAGARQGTSSGTQPGPLPNEGLFVGEAVRTVFDDRLERVERGKRDCRSADLRDRASTGIDEVVQARTVDGFDERQTQGLQVREWRGYADRSRARLERRSECPMRPERVPFSSALDADLAEPSPTVLRRVCDLTAHPGPVRSHFGGTNPCTFFGCSPHAFRIETPRQSRETKIPRKRLHEQVLAHPRCRAGRARQRAGGSCTCAPASTRRRARPAARRRETPTRGSPGRHGR